MEKNGSGGLLFVYGTLKRGMRAHRFLGGARFVGVGRTGPEWTLLSNGSFPALVEAPTDLDPDLCGVFGEVFEIVDENAWSGLDAYEGVSSGLYERREIRLAEFGPDFSDSDQKPDGKTGVVQTYVFCGRRTGFTPHGNVW